MSLSYHHAYICSNLTALLHQKTDYSVFTELTLQIDAKDYIPDISIYPKRKVNLAAGDMLRMTEMPLVAIEILSPKQGMQDILDKFAVYFNAGIQSCWLVIPVAQIVMVYHSLEHANRFYEDQIIDTAVNIRISWMAIFAA